jgi:hypothetical protein
MRKTKKFQIDGHAKGFEVKELTVKQIVSIAQDNLFNTEKDLGLLELLELVENDIAGSCSNITREDVMEMTPSEVKQIWNHFSEVNDSFFVILKNLGLEKVADNLWRSLLKDFSEIAAGSSKLDTLES